jgi:diamine N-acetyltransferase
MKNWKGLKFWSKNGFNTIMGIYGDKEYTTDSFAIMGLKKKLTSK